YIKFGESCFGRKRIREAGATAYAREHRAERLSQALDLAEPDQNGQGPVKFEARMQKHRKFLRRDGEVALPDTTPQAELASKQTLPASRVGVSCRDRVMALIADLLDCCRLRSRFQCARDDGAGGCQCLVTEVGHDQTMRVTRSTSSTLVCPASAFFIP